MPNRYSVMLLLDRKQATVVRAGLLELQEHGHLLVDDEDALYSVLAELSKKMHEETKAGNE